MSDGKTDSKQDEQKLADAGNVVDDAVVADEAKIDYDFSKEGISAKVPSPQTADEYNPRPQEDTARRRIAYLLLGLLWVLVAGIFILLAFKSIEVADLEAFAVLLGPVVTLVSAATGFYYGTKSS